MTDDPTVRDEMLTPAEAAELVGVHPQTLLTWRRTGVGPRHAKLGYRTVRYRRSDVEAWIAARTREQS